MTLNTYRPGCDTDSDIDHTQKKAQAVADSAHTIGTFRFSHALYILEVLFCMYVQCKVVSITDALTKATDLKAVPLPCVLPLPSGRPVSRWRSF